MSSFIIVGFLGLTSGRRVRSDVTRPDGTALVLWHVFYDTCIICSQPPSPPTELRKYSPISDIVYPDDTVAFVVAKAYVPPVNFSKTVLLDAILMIPVPGDPSSVEYDERVPDLCTPLVFGIGTVAAAQESAPNTPVYFPTTVSDFVRGSPKQTVIHCRLDKSIARWRNVPTPNRGALICFLGTCFELVQSGHLCVDLLNIVFLASTPLTPPQTVTGDSNAASGSLSRKRQKFAARTATDASDISLESPTRSSMNASVANLESSSPLTQPNTPSDVLAADDDGPFKSSEPPLFPISFYPPPTLAPPNAANATQEDANTKFFKEPEPLPGQSTPSTRSKGKRKAQA